MPTSPATSQRHLASFLRMIFKAGKEEVEEVEEERRRRQWRRRRQEATGGGLLAFFDVQKRGGRWLVAAKIEVRCVHVSMLHKRHARTHIHTHTNCTHTHEHPRTQACTHTHRLHTQLLAHSHLLITLAKGVLECVYVR